MANRDLFRGAEGYETRRPRRGGRLRGFWGRLLLQSAAAMALFCGVVYLYEEESRLGEGVRYIVALARTDGQELMAVGSFDEVWQGLLQSVTADDDSATGGQTLEGETTAAAATQAIPGPGEDYLATAQADAQGNLVMILPTSGLMQGAFGDIDEAGLKVTGLKIFCQRRQEVKAAAIGEVAELADGEKIVLRHRDGVESCYIGTIESAVQEGEVLRQGQLLGYVEESTLLFQVLREGEPVDPFLFVKGPQ